MAVIDINARTVSRATRVWRLFPGASYVFQKAFIENNAGYLDLPGVTLPDRPLLKAKDLNPRIAMASAIKSLIPSGPTADMINLDVKSFAEARDTKLRGQFRQSIINFYEEAKTGDLVIAPQSLENKRVWAGEFLNDDINYIDYYRYGEFVKVPSRSIRWSREVPENILSSKLSDSLRHQQPFTLLEKSLFVEVISILYSSFVYGDRHVATIYNGDQFLDADASFISNVSKFAAAACKANEEQTSIGDILGILIKNPDYEYSCNQECDIHSEGFIRFICGKPVPLILVTLAASFIYLGSFHSKAEIKAEIDKLEFINSSPNSDPLCNARVREASKQLLLTMDLDKLVVACQAAREVAARANLRPSAQTLKPSKPK